MINRRLSTPLLALATILGVVAAGCAKSGGSVHPEIAAETRANTTPVTVVPNPVLTRVGAESIADITERVLPSVVNISMTKVTKMSASPMPFMPFFGPQGQEDRRENEGAVAEQRPPQRPGPRDDPPVGETDKRHDPRDRKRLASEVRRPVDAGSQHDSDRPDRSPHQWLEDATEDELFRDRRSGHERCGRQSDGQCGVAIDRQE